MQEIKDENVSKELAKVRLESETLQLEDLRYRVMQQRARREEILRAHQVQSAELEFAAARLAAEQAACVHKKGGKNLENFFNGHDSKYCVIKNTYPWGEKHVLCTRCGKEWRPPMAGLKKENPVLYKDLLRQYREALAFPTDNEDSGTQMFTFSKAS